MDTAAYIGIGSNLGDKLKNCRTAIELIDQIGGCRVASRSKFYRTEPVGVTGHDWYVNSVISVATSLPAPRLLEELLSIERVLGRKRQKKWDPRIIDLDILLYGSEVLDQERLTVPHPLMHMRRFILLPMVCLAPSLLHPVLLKTMADLLNQLGDRHQSVALLEEG